MNASDLGRPATRFLPRDEGRIAYDVDGTGPLVVLVPGMADLRSSFRLLAPALIAAGFRVATTDLRGHGDSDTTFTSYGDAATADDISALITELGGPAAVVGNSLAAGAAVIAAADHPELISDLVLIGPFVRNPRSAPGMRTLMRLLVLPPWGAAVWKSYLPSLYAGTKPADFDHYRDQLVTKLRQPGYGKAFAQTVAQTDHAVAEARLGEVTARTLVVMGEQDPDFADPTAEARWIGEAVNGRVVMVDEAGHYPQSQQPELTATVVLEFLKEAHVDAESRTDH
ncbi:MAG: alpha/beta hydrolase [Actinobacteria bacterium HGW-Actinobacteria-2]|nr:MAG: alpha/beta hydrolase [Actinobacteria bacterium HGW-Actinobacteria-2]